MKDDERRFWRYGIDEAVYAYMPDGEDAEAHALWLATLIAEENTTMSTGRSGTFRQETSDGRYPPSVTLRLGTDRQQAPTGSPDWYLTETTGLPRLMGRVQAAIAPRWRRVGPDGVRGDFPAGVGHAVPADSTVALCGVTPPHLWNGDFNARSRVVDPCPRCVELLPPS